MALREAREARARGETPESWAARALSSALGDRLGALGGKSDRSGDGVDVGDVGGGGGGDARAGRGTADADATFEARDRDASDDGRWDSGAVSARADEARDGERESDGAGAGVRVLRPETFESAVAGADAGGRWLVAACARSSPTCRALAPELAILALDSAFTSSQDGGAGFSVGWVDCSPESARGWCVERLGAKAVPRLIAVANGRERAYEGAFRGTNYMRDIRAFAESFASEREGEN